MSESEDLIASRAKERGAASFNVRDLTYFLDNGKQNTLRNESIMLQFERDPLFNIKTFNLDLKGQREVSFQRITKLAAYNNNDDEQGIRARMNILSISDPGTYTRVGVHYGLFLQTLRALGTPQQFQYWVSKGAGSLSKFFGCFGMTELAHGSNVAGLQTVAIFNPSDDTFTINTPNLGATKWWIGGAAHSATHCVVYARLVVKGKDYGVKNFVVQLRNDNGELLPGVAIGDIGKKMGRDGIDNGWIQFTNVKIPRFNMLSKYAQVDAKGKVTVPEFQQLGYSALVMGRVSMVVDSYNIGKKFITIALRYATVRRQFGKDSDGLEKKIIDYTHHRRRLFPFLATIYAFNSSALEITRVQDETLKLLAGGDKNVKDVIPNLKDLFSLSAGLKAFATWETAKLIDEARQSCGGHGYSSYNGFAQGYNDWVVQCTWEGDNNVLSLSCGRALIQNYLAVEKGERVGDFTNYLKVEDNDDFVLRTQDLEYIEKIIIAWEIVSKRLVQSSTAKFKQFRKETNGDLELAFEKVASNRFNSAKIHTKLVILKTFHQRVSHAPENLKSILSLLLQLYALHITSENISQFYSFNIVKGSDFLENLNYKIDEINELLRPNIIGLTDAFNLSDFMIGSQIGKKNGDIYENYFKFVTDNNTEIKPHYYDTLMKPFFERSLKPTDNEEVQENEEDDE